MSQPNLQAAFFFSADDLNANRRGIVTDAQIARLRKLRRQGVPLLILAVLAAGLAIGVRNDAAWLSIVMVAFIVLLVAAAIGFWRRFDRESQSPRVASVRGPASKRYFAGRNRRFFLRVGEVEFSVMVYQYNAVMEGRSYRVYYTPITRTILSLEADDEPA